MQIAVEGIDGTGKTTTAKMLAKELGFQYHSKAIHRMQNYKRANEYDNFISLNECMDEETERAWEYGVRASFLYERMKNTDTVTERYFCSNYAVKPSSATLEEIKKCIEIFGVPDMTIILYCRPEINYKRLYNRNPNDKDIPKLKRHKDFYDNIKRCTEILKLANFFLDTSEMSLEEVVNKLTAYIKKIPVKRESHRYTAQGIERDEFIMNEKGASILGLSESCRKKKIVLPRGIKKIGFSAFASSDIEEVFMNDECEEISCGAFCNCKNLRYIKLSPKIKYVGKNLFAGCGLIEIEGGNENIGTRENTIFQGEKIIKSNIKKSMIEDEFSVEHGAWSYENNKYVRKITAPKLKIIGAYAYKDSGLEEISLAECEEIHERAFWNCKNLKVIKFSSSKPPRIYPEILLGVREAVEILVPTGSVGSYEAAFQSCKNVEIKEC